MKYFWLKNNITYLNEDGLIVVLSQIADPNTKVFSERKGFLPGGHCRISDGFGRKDITDSAARRRARQQRNYLL